MTADAIAATLNGSADADSVVVDGGRLDGPATVSGARLARLEIRDVVCRGDLTITGCRIDVLEISQLQLARGSAFALHDSVVDTIELRSFSGRGPASLDRVRAAAMTLHDIDRVSLLACAADAAIALSRIRGSLGLNDIACGELVIRDMDDDELSIRLRDVSCRRELEVHSGSLRDIRLSEVRAEAVRVHRIVTRTEQAGLALEGCATEGDLTLDTFTNTRGPSLGVRQSRLGGSLLLGALDVPAEIEAVAELDDCFIAGDLRIAKQPPTAPPCRVRETSVAGTLRLASLESLPPAGSRGVVTLEGSSVGDMTLPVDRLRTRTAVERLAEQLFGSSTVDGLAALRTALAGQHRPLDEDAVYAVLQDQLSERSGTRRAWRALLGDVFGWGVRLGPPARALLVLIIATTAVVFAVASGNGGVAHRAMTASLRAIGLWTNVDVNLAGEPTSDAYAVLRVVSGAGGIVLITVLVGIVIRKLVR